MAQSLRLVVGLGNPGPEYADTRHNIGFMAAEAIAAREGLGWKKKFKGEFAAGVSKAGGDRPFLLLKPLTYMNLSGESVGEALRFHKLAPADVIVFHDELDLPAGEVRIKQGGGNAGHNGLKSIDQHIGPDYWRVRIGIGHPGEKGDAVTNHVLAPFTKADKAWVATLLERIAGNFGELLAGQTAKFLEHFTGS